MDEEILLWTEQPFKDPPEDLKNASAFFFWLYFCLSNIQYLLSLSSSRSIHPSFHSHCTLTVKRGGSSTACMERGKEGKHPVQLTRPSQDTQTDIDTPFTLQPLFNQVSPSEIRDLFYKGDLVQTATKQQKNQMHLLIWNRQITQITVIYCSLDLDHNYKRRRNSGWDWKGRISSI